MLILLCSLDLDSYLDSNAQYSYRHINLKRFRNGYFLLHLPRKFFISGTPVRKSSLLYNSYSLDTRRFPTNPTIIVLISSLFGRENKAQKVIRSSSNGSRKWQLYSVQIIFDPFAKRIKSYTTNRISVSMDSYE